jgi:hypothetical protein
MLMVSFSGLQMYMIFRPVPKRFCSLLLSYRYESLPETTARGFKLALSSDFNAQKLNLSNLRNAAKEAIWTCHHPIA